jgi:FAD/FMN-containing dehydrogenase
MKRVAESLSSIVGADNVFAGADIEERYRLDILAYYRSSPAFVVRPGNTAEVAAIVRLADQENLSITPLGGRTGVVGGGIAEDGAIVLSLERMNKILEIDAAAMTMTVEAGSTLQSIHEAAEAQGLFMPLDLGARGSATIGGNIATNAGGNRVLRWGMMRDMVLGLEAVLADGSVVSSLSKALKDNAGYQWKHLLIGSEGTLGIVTRAVLRLRPLPLSSQTALVAFDSFEHATAVLRRLDAALGGRLSSFELMWDDFYEFVSEAQLPKRARALPCGYALYALIESMGCEVEHDAALFAEVLEKALTDEIVKDVVIAQSQRERDNLWAVRDDLTEAFRPLRPMVAFDVSMALSDMPVFRTETRAQLRERFPQATVLYYGHAGDGNLHIVVSMGETGSAKEVDMLVYAVVQKYHGSVSGEHGIGQGKREYIGLTRSAQELALMRSIKNAFDPKNRMNPGKVLPSH